MAVSLSTVATALLVSPVSSHRMLFRRGAKDTLVTTGDRLAKAGLVALGLTVTTVVLLIFNVVVGEAAGWVAAACMLDVLHAELADPAAVGLALPPRRSAGS